MDCFLLILIRVLKAIIWDLDGFYFENPHQNVLIFSECYQRAVSLSFQSELRQLILLGAINITEIVCNYIIKMLLIL